MPVDSKALARQVLRHIREPAALRTNPLTERFFRAALNADSSLTTIRAIIVAALPQDSRMRRIVEECDFSGRPHKAVRREMVLSERQFYRERSHAFELVAHALQQEPVTSTGADAPLVLRIESLYDLLTDGYAAAVRRAAEQTLAGGVPRWAASRLLALKAAAYSKEGDALEASAALRRAEEHALGAVERADILAARAVAADVRGQLADCIALVGEAVKSTRAEPVLADPAGLRAHLRYLCWFANLHEENDDAAGALRLFELTHGLVLSRSPSDIGVVGWIKLYTACVTLCLRTETNRAVEELRDAQSLASRIGSPALDAWVECILACATVCANPPAALAHARVAVELAMSALAGETLARVLLTCARIATMCGDAPGAIGLIEIARRHCVPGGYMESISMFRHADALGLIGLHVESARLAELACTRIAAVNRSHYLGSAHLAAATSAAALGRSQDAMGHVETALPLLETAGFLFEFKRANQLAARISGRAIYVDRAEEIGRLTAAS